MAGKLRNQVFHIVFEGFYCFGGFFFGVLFCLPIWLLQPFCGAACD